MLSKAQIMSLKCCLTTFWVSPVSKIGLGVECFSLWAALCCWKTQIWTSCWSITNDCVHVHLPQENEPTLKTTLDSWVQGTRKVLVTILRHELLASYFMNTHKQIFFFPLLGASTFSHEADFNVSAGICKNSLSFFQDLFMLHCLGSLGTFTFLWLTADNYDYVFKFS